MPHTTARANYRDARRAERVGAVVEDLAFDPYEMLPGPVADPYQALASLRRSIITAGISWRTEWDTADPTAAEAILRAAFGSMWRETIYWVRRTAIPLAGVQ